MLHKQAQHMIHYYEMKDECADKLQLARTFLKKANSKPSTSDLVKSRVRVGKSGIEHLVEPG
jgi:hypothetical protein